MTSRPARLRCAIYTRKSSEEGLDQDYNSLHAQRDACEAYVRSQAGEGWTALAAAYDDGGFSGGTLDRPALKRLLADIDRGGIDVVVVYKVDRLTRSLTDFAKIVEAFDARGVSFVSVTQAFNTTSSMGRLTLNVLLSFAQFEREVTGERIRDKIAASKAKGIWMGGMLPLGYDAQDRKLVVNVAEAELVRRIFQRYLVLKSVHRLRDEFSDEGHRSKAWISSRGRAMGGAPFGRGALFHLLQSRLYLGEVPHKSENHPGLHEAIVPAELFDAVQAQLALNRRARQERPDRAGASPLAGLVFDGKGEPMGPSFGYGRWGGRYRYYVSISTQRGLPVAAADASMIRRVSAAPLERLVLECLRRLAPDTIAPLEWSQVRQGLRRVEINSDSIGLQVSTTMIDAGKLAEASDLRVDRGRKVMTIGVPVRAVFRGGRTSLQLPRKSTAPGPRGDPDLARALRTLHRALAKVGASPAGSITRDLAALQDTQVRQLLPLAFLAPEIQRAILEGQGPVELSLDSVGEIPLAWEDQRARFPLERAI